MCDLSVVSALAVSPAFGVPPELALSLPVLAAMFWQREKPTTLTPMREKSFVLHDVTVINPRVERLEHRSVTLRDGVIEGIGDLLETPADAELAQEFAGAYALPGLVDMHTHLPPANFMKLTPYFCLMYLAYGVTSIREAGDVDGTAVPAARQGIADGSFPGPRIFSCGPFISGAARQRWSNVIQLKEPGQADAAVAQVKANGHQFVKSYEDLMFRQIRELEAAAKRHGLPMLGHVPTALGYEEALIPEPQHFLGVPEPKSLAQDHILNRMADWQDVDDARMKFLVNFTVDHQMANTPTLVITARMQHYENYDAACHQPVAHLLPRIYRDVIWHPVQGVPVFRAMTKDLLTRLRDSFPKKKELVARLHEAGTKLYLGTDTQQPFVAPGASLQEEMQIFADAGISLEHIWEIATRSSGQALGVPKLGTLVNGAPADLLLFKEDPTANLGALKTLMAVVTNGKLYRKADIDAALKGSRKRYNGMMFDRGTVTATRMIMQRTATRDY